MDKSHYNLLKSLLITNDEVTPESDSRIEYLRELGYLKIEDSYYVVTEHGKSAMYEFRLRNFKIRSAVILSIAATVISLLGWLFPKEQVIYSLRSQDAVYETEHPQNQAPGADDDMP